jgi:hypothetical protein
MTDPNINATPQSVADSLAGTADGSPLSFRLVALLQPSEIFGLGSSYPFPEGPNTSPSQLDQTTTMAKILTRTFVGSDGKTYDIFDMLATLLEAHLSSLSGS